MNALDPIAVGQEIERLVANLQTSGSAPAADARRLVQHVMALHGAGLSRLLEIVSEDGSREALMRRLRSDPLVASLLALHDLQTPEPGPVLLQIQHQAASVAASEPVGRDEHCRLCSATLPDTHAHLVDVETRRLLCACEHCKTVGGKFRLVPARYVHHPAMTMSSAEWDALGVPVGLAFFVVSSHLGRAVVNYPGPAGATESLLPLEIWPLLTVQHAWIRDLAPDVEALLVRRIGNEYRCFIVPLDACYELVGRIRQAWTGFGGGQGADSEIEKFFSDVMCKAERFEALT